jgi:hypothetical protein
MTEIHIQLADEGTEVWRPVMARPIALDVYEIPSTTVVPREESWLFNPGDQVRCEERRLSGSLVLVAVELVHAAG